jgi:hypothetical protein
MEPMLSQPLGNCLAKPRLVVDEEQMQAGSVWH